MYGQIAFFCLYLELRDLCTQFFFTCDIFLELLNIFLKIGRCPYVHSVVRYHLLPLAFLLLIAEFLCKVQIVLGNFRSTTEFQIFFSFSVKTLW